MGEDEDKGEIEDLDEGYSWKAFFPFTEEGKRMREEKKRERKREEEDEEDFSLEPYLRKAGYDELDETTVKKVIFNVSIGISLLISFFILLTATQGNQGVWNLLVFMAGYWTFFFLLVLTVVAFAFTMWLDLRAYKRTKEIEEVLPDFLQLASANVSAGMPLDRALWFAVRPNFGILAEEIETVAKATYAGRDLKSALREFADKFDSQKLDRAVSLILEGMAAGGEMADLLNKIAVNIEETNILKKEMSANVTTYVIFIGMATLLGAPFLFGLATQLLIVIKSIAGSIGDVSAGAGGMFAFQINADAVTVSDFKIYSSLMLAVSSFFSGAIISVIRKGNIKEGAVVIPAFIITTQALYYIANLALGGLMSAFI